VREGRFINVRKLAALDLVYRGRQRAMLEFAFAFLFLLAVGVAFFFFARSPSVGTQALGVYLVLLGLNYAPLFAYGISIGTVKKAQEEAAFELAHQDVYRTRYGVQQMLILVPLSIDLLAILQEARKN
jgi:hypothetical protein